jgi:hypothetical protein
MWCCVGSGLENHTKYGELIYSHNADDIFVNLFVPSVLNWNEKGIKLDQSTNFPYKNETVLTLELEKPQTFAINIRLPEWMQDLEILVNGKAQKIGERTSGYAQLDRKWKAGDKVVVRFKTQTRMEYLPDGSNWAAFVNGPIVLAAKTSTENLDGLFADDSRMGHETKGRLYPLDEAFVLVGEGKDHISKIRPLGNLEFELDTLLLQPFYEIHEARYQMYFQTFSKEGHAENKAALKQRETEALLLESRTVDLVNCGEQQPEVDHGYSGEESRSGYDDGYFWRSTRSYISYGLSDKNGTANAIEITALDVLKEGNFEILINDRPAEKVTMEGKKIRLEIAESKGFVLKIRAKNGQETPRFNQIRLLRR